MKKTFLTFFFFGISFLVSQSNNTVLNSPLSVLGNIKEKTILDKEIKVLDFVKYKVGEGV